MCFTFELCIKLKKGLLQNKIQPKDTKALTGVQDGHNCNPIINIDIKVVTYFLALKNFPEKKYIKFCFVTQIFQVCVVL